MVTKYIGRIVDVIYRDRSGQFTKRRVQIRSVKNGRAKVYCLERQAPRILIVENILAIQPAAVSRVG